MKKYVKIPLFLMCLPLLLSNSAAPITYTEEKLLDTTILNIKETSVISSSHLLLNIENNSENLVTYFAISIKEEESDDNKSYIWFSNTILPNLNISLFFEDTVAYNSDITYSFSVSEVFGYNKEDFTIFDINPKYEITSSWRESINDFSYYAYKTYFDFTFTLENSNYGLLFFTVNTDIDSYTANTIYFDLEYVRDRNVTLISTQSELNIVSNIVGISKSSSSKGSGFFISPLLIFGIIILAYALIVLTVILITQKVKKNKRNK